MSLDKLRGRLMISLVLGAVVFIGLSAYADFSDVIDGLGSFKWQYLPIVLALDERQLPAALPQMAVLPQNDRR